MKVASREHQSLCYRNARTQARKKGNYSCRVVFQETQHTLQSDR